MSNALTLNDMSPALRKVVETRSHESHRRKSRMREIRSSGSGEGPGWATSRPTLQRPFPPPAAPLPPGAAGAARGGLLPGWGDELSIFVQITAVLDGVKTSPPP